MLRRSRSCEGYDVSRYFRFIFQTRKGVVDDIRKSRGVEELALIVVHLVFGRHIGETKVNLVGLEQLMHEAEKPMEIPVGMLHCKSDTGGIELHVPQGNRTEIGWLKRRLAGLRSPGEWLESLKAEAPGRS